MKRNCVLAARYFPAALLFNLSHAVSRFPAYSAFALRIESAWAVAGAPSANNSSANSFCLPLIAAALVSVSR
jgi:hypothetical protein